MGTRHVNMGKISNLNAQIPFGKDEENQAGLKTETAVILREKSPFALPVFPVFYLHEAIAFFKF
jgi:hypothetical protein